MINRYQIVKRIKIGAVLVISFFLAQGINDVVFIADSPQLRQDSMGYVASLVRNSLPGQSTPNAVQKQIEGAVVQQMSTGVYAGEREQEAVRVYQLDEITWEEYTYITSDGRNVTIRVPSGEAPPPGVQEQDLIETD